MGSLACWCSTAVAVNLSQSWLLLDGVQYDEEKGNEAFADDFQQAMTYFTKLSLRGGEVSLKDAFDWSKTQCVMDVGGGARGVPVALHAVCWVAMQRRAHGSPLGAGQVWKDNPECLIFSLSRDPSINPVKSTVWSWNSDNSSITLCYRGLQVRRTKHLGLLVAMSQPCISMKTGALLRGGHIHAGCQVGNCKLY